MKEEREALIRENEERMARRKAYIRSLEKDIARCEVKESVGSEVASRREDVDAGCVLTDMRTQKSIHDMKTKTGAHLSIIESLMQPLKVSLLFICTDSSTCRPLPTALIQDLHQRLTAKELTSKLERFLPIPSYFADINSEETKTTEKAVSRHRHCVHADGHPTCSYSLDPT